MGTPGKPNILLITDDQHRWDFFGDTGAVSSLRTPSLDRLRAEGTTFTNCYSVCPLCMPARFSWCYGLYASQAAQRLMGNDHDWPAALRSMPQALQAAGYHTALIGKLHSHAGLYSLDITVDEWRTRDRGFDHVEEVSGKSLSYWYDCRWTHYLKEKGLLGKYREDLIRRNAQLGGGERYEPSLLSAEDSMDAFIGRRAAGWIDGYDGARPFFLHASLCGPHFPLDPPREYFERYEPSEMPPPVGVDDREEEERWRRLRALYCGLIEQVDGQVGRILDSLERRGWREDTVVLFCTDHGDMIGDLGRNHKSVWQDPSCRTPLTVAYPGVVPQGETVDALVESVDLPCTLLDLAGCDVGGSLPQSPGRSFWPLASSSGVDARSQGRDWAYSECGVGAKHWRMVVDREWKFVWHLSEGEMLFHRTEDPHDAVNLAGDDPMKLMRQRLIESMASCVAPNSEPSASTGEF